jgi:hypothetical protein
MFIKWSSLQKSLSKFTQKKFYVIDPCSIIFLQISDAIQTQSVVQHLFNCINTACCPTPGTVATAAKCNAAYGHTGETITPIANTNINRQN